MTDAAPAPPSQPKSRHASIRVRILLALLLLSLFPLILFVTLSLYSIANAEGYIRNELIRESQKDVFRLVKVQAAIANAMLDKIEAETQMIAYFAQRLMRDPAAFSPTRSYSADEKPDDPSKATKYILAPGVSIAAARPVLDMTSNLDELFQLIKKGDPNLEYIVIGTESVVYREYPWDSDSFERFAFILDPTIAPPSSDDGILPAPLRQAFKHNGFDLSPDAALRTVDPGAAWAVLDERNDRSFNLRREEAGLAV